VGQQKAVPFGELLDVFGKNLTEIIEELKHDSLKPAIVSDIVKSLSGLYHIQQLFVLFYNLHVKNFDILMQDAVNTKKKTEELETRMAGYSSEINTLRGRIAKLEINNKGGKLNQE